MTGVLPSPISRSAFLAGLDARFRRPLMSYFRRRVRDPAEAEDLTQQVFMKLVASLDSPGFAIEHADGLVFTVAANLLRDRARRAQRAHPAGPHFDRRLISEICAEAIDERSPERILLGQETLGAALKALDSLGQKTRDIFILHRLEKMKHREIADLFGLSVSTVEKHVMKATLFLARRYVESEL